MKRLIRSISPVFCMAVDRPKAEKILKKNAETLQRHILKCVVYEDSTGNLKHWVEDEISEYLSIANDVVLKPDSKKCKPKFYEETLFSFIGDAEIDAKTDLRLFLQDVLKTKEYPTFEITNDLIHRLYVVYQTFVNTFVPILSKKNDFAETFRVRISCW